MTLDIIPETGSLQTYTDLARQYPNQRNDILNAAVQYMNHPLSYFIKELDMDVNDDCFHISEWQDMTALDIAMYNADANEVDTLLAMGAELTDEAFDILFNGRGSYYTWACDYSAKDRASEINNILSVINNHGIAFSYYPASWWWEDFKMHASLEHPYIDCPIDCMMDLKHYLEEEDHDDY